MTTRLKVSVQYCERMFEQALSEFINATLDANDNQRPEAMALQNMLRVMMMLQIENAKAVSNLSEDFDRQANAMKGYTSPTHAAVIAGAQAFLDRPSR